MYFYIYILCCSVGESCPTLHHTHGLQDTRLLYLSPYPRACSNSCPLSWWCHPTISSSIVHFSPCLQYFPASGSFLMSRLYQVTYYWSFSISPSNEYSGLISFRVDWVDLLAVQGTVKSLLPTVNTLVTKTMRWFPSILQRWSMR